MRFGCDLGLRFESSGWVVSFEIFSFRFTNSDFNAPAPRRAEDLHEPPQRCWAVGLRPVPKLLLQKLQVSLSNAIAFLRDSAAVNGAAVDTLSTTFNGARPERAV